MTTFHPGSTPASTKQKITVTSITISEMKVVPQNGVQLDAEEE